MARITLQNIGTVLRDKRGGRGIREVSKEIGVSPSTLSRIECGKLPDLDTFVKICKWLSIDPGEVLGHKTQEQKTAGRYIFAHFRAERNLNSETASALSELIIEAQKIIED